MRTTLLLVCSVSLLGCPSEDGPAQPDTTDIQSDVADTDDAPSECQIHLVTGFDDHTRPSLPQLECLAEGDLRKFVLTGFSSNDAQVTAHFYEEDFYRLHDEWYFFRLLNGQPIPGLTIAPLTGSSFPSVASIYEYFATTTQLPLGLSRLSGESLWPDRIYAPRFYELSGLSGTPIPRHFGLGTLYRFAANPARAKPEAFWAFDLEYSDTPSMGLLTRFFNLLEPRLPPEVQGKLHFLARSPSQRTLIEQAKDLQHPLAARLLTYDALSAPGELVIYNEGISAGTVQRLDTGFSPSLVRSNGLTLLPELPDDLPPSRAILSSVPQSALSHLNLLAQARGTPNAYLGGLMGRTDFRDWAYLDTPVLMLLEEGQLHLQEITPAVLREYEQRLNPAPPQLAEVDIASLPLGLSLESLSAEDARALSAGFGGKSSGLALLYAHGHAGLNELPPQALAISIRPYTEHLAPHRERIASLISHPDFQSSSRLRHLVLEGPDAFSKAYGQDGAAHSLLLRTLERQDAIGQVVKEGGIQGILQSATLNPDTHAQIRTLLREHFSTLSPLQGLRFRSSSTAEDLPGFHGAGLYDSNTGFLYPSQLSSASDRARTIEAAIKKTWASYWGFYAFEERQRVGIDHLKAGMGLTVHARFDDPLERFNAVATLQLNLYPGRTFSTLSLQLRPGALAVTNPGGGTSGLESIRIERTTPNAPPHIVGFDAATSLITAPELERIFAIAEAHAESHLALEQTHHPDGEGPQSLTLDFELKGLFEGWPALASGEVLPARIIWRQARPLEGLPRLPRSTPAPFVLNQPLLRYVPQDLLGALSEIQVKRCQSATGNLTLFEAKTEVSATFAPFADSPLRYRALIDLAGGHSFDLSWQDFSVASDGSLQTSVLEAYDIEALRLGGDSASPTFDLKRDGTWTRTECLGFEQATPYESPERFLRAKVVRESP